MNIAWRKKYSINLIVSRIRTTRYVVGDKVEIRRDVGRGWEHVLTSALSAEGLVDDDDLSLAVRKALFDPQCSFATPAEVQACIIKHILDEKRTPTKTYRLFVEITSPTMLVGRRILCGATMQTAPSQNTKWFRKAIGERKYIVESNTNYPIGDAGIYLPVIITVDEKDQFRAFRNGLRKFEVIRAIMNLISNRKSAWRLSFGYPPAPVNDFLLGPLHTVHDENGVLVGEKDFWFELDFHRSPTAKVKDPAEFESAVIKVAKELESNPLREFVEEGLRRYVSALDHRRWQEAVVELWSALEHLTVSKEQNSDALVARASSIYPDRDDALQFLQHLRQHRNVFVHESRAVDHSLAESLMYQAKRHVEDLLWLFVRNRVGLRNPQEAAQFLDVTSNRKALERQREILESAAVFRGW